MVQQVVAAAPGGPDYQPPRWVLRAIAAAVATLAACSFVAANVFPSKWPSSPRAPYEEHGWPFGYMARSGVRYRSIVLVEHRPHSREVVHPFTAHCYHCWPLMPTRLVEFRRIPLIVDVLCCGLLTALAALIPVYSLRVRGRPVQYSLRGLLALTTVCACSLGLVRSCRPKWTDPDCLWDITVCSLPWWLLCAILVGLVIVAAHWAVARSVKSGRARRWQGVHWVSWLAITAVGIPFLHYSLLVENWAPFPLSLTPGRTDVCGWPLQYSYIDIDIGSPGKCFALWALAADALVWLAATVAAGFVVERWVRRVEQRIAVRPIGFFSLLFVAGIVFWIANNDTSYSPSWYDYPSWLLGLAAVVYAAELLILEQLNRVAKFSLFTGLCAGVLCWLALLALLGPCGILAGLSLAVGAFAALVIDAAYRLLSHPEVGVSRFIRRDCGGRIALAPVWIVALLGVIGGYALIYWQS